MNTRRSFLGKFLALAAVAIAPIGKVLEAKEKSHLQEPEWVTYGNPPSDGKFNYTRALSRDRGKTWEYQVKDKPMRIGNAIECNGAGIRKGTTPYGIRYSYKDGTKSPVYRFPKHGVSSFEEVDRVTSYAKSYDEYIPKVEYIDTTNIEIPKGKYVLGWDPCHEDYSELEYPNRFKFNQINYDKQYLDKVEDTAKASYQIISMDYGTGEIEYKSPEYKGDIMTLLNKKV